MTNAIDEPPVIGPDHQLAAPQSIFSRHRSRWIVFGSLALLVLVIVTLLLISHYRSASKAAALARMKPVGISITTATAETGSIGVYLDSIGTVTPVYTASITSEVTGQIAAVHYREGQLVSKGEPLVDIDPRPFQAMLLQAQGTLARDEGVLAQAQMDFDRYRAAGARHAIAQQILDDQEKLVLQDKGTVMNDQGIVQFDQIQLEFCHITAPIAGRVGLRLVDPGNVVQSAGTVTLAVITQIKPITVIFTIPEDSLDGVEAQLRVAARLSVDAYDRTGQKRVASGYLLTIDNQIDTTTGTVKGRALFDNKDEAFFPNQFVNTRLLVNTVQGVTLIPTSAVQQNGQASFVYVILKNVAELRSVKTGITEGGKTQVDGIAAGDVVANSSFDKLQDKAAVVISTKLPPASTAAGVAH
jgi:membrane fusion protein, multidrug efflux system